MNTSIKRVLTSCAALLGIILLGTLGYSVLEDWSILDSLWMTVITMSTVGYGEVAPLDPPGRILTLWIIFGTVLIGGYTIGNLSAFLIGGEIWDTIRGKRLYREIDRSKDHTVLVAYGRVGKAAVEHYPKAKANLIIIERDQNVVLEAQEKGFMVIQGDATHEEILEKAHIERAKSLIIASGHVADNVLIALTAREMNPSLFIVARGEDAGSESKLKRAGADRVVVPNLMGGRRLSAFIRQPGVMDFLDVAMHGDNLSLRLAEVRLERGSDLIAQSLKDSDIRSKSKGALIMAVRKAGGEMVSAPSSDYVMEENDLLIVLGTDDQISRMNKLAKD